ncbi:DeoR/GlpR transcriptional regulator [Planctomycetales bacterium ZRK34]|nr:DeoR/GlpR transcriptional regulator [Planctomycetales bacterium ZRK34]
MLILERQQRLLDLLRDRGAADLDSLAEVVGVSPSTVRRDLDALEQQGVIERTHGGAVYRGQRRHPIAFDERLDQQVDAKKAIGQYAASLIEPGMTLALDGGSTVYYAAQLITARPLQIVTNSLTIANLFANDEQIELLLIGGSLYPRTGVLVGPIATTALSNLHADLLLFSVAGLFDDEAYNLNLEQAEVERVMLAQAARAVMLMDASKFGRKSLARVCDVEQVEAVVTDAAISERWRQRYGERLQVAE